MTVTDFMQVNAGQT